MGEVTDPSLLQQLNGGQSAPAMGVPALRRIVGPQPKQPPGQTPQGARNEQLQGVKMERELSQPVLTKGQQAVDETFGKEYADWKAMGGFSDVKKQLLQLRDAHTKLGGPSNLTGPVLGRLPDAITAFANPEAINVRQEVEDSIQRSLRAVLGAQYTEKEGARMVARAYDPSLPERTNRVRITRIFNQLAEAAKAKESASRYFEKNGTLTGWKGKLWGLSDIDPERAQVAKPSGNLTTGADGVLEWHP